VLDIAEPWLVYTVSSTIVIQASYSLAVAGQLSIAAIQYHTPQYIRTVLMRCRLPELAGQCTGSPASWSIIRGSAGCVRLLVARAVSYSWRHCWLNRRGVVLDIISVLTVGVTLTLPSIASCYGTGSQRPHRFCPLQNDVEYVVYIDRQHAWACQIIIIIIIIDIFKVA